jgi:phosphatidylinositol alpha-1,6-mannosyltransferase
MSYCDLIPERVLVLNNTVQSRFTPGDRLAARTKFGLGDEFVLLTVGRLDARERYKGHDRVIAALPLLHHREGRQIVYHIAGDGDDRVRLEAAAKTAGVAERVRFLGQVPAADLPDLYRSADLFVLPSHGEGFGIAFLEATASGTPALGLAAGGAPDALGDGALGTLVGCVGALPEALQVAIAAPRPDAAMLSDATASKFGALGFQERIVGSFRLLDL